jgi:photosystem II oxygen-evolving enhancer protein 2
MHSVLQNEVDGRTCYTFEFTVQAPNYTRHALGAIAIGNDIELPC